MKERIASFVIERLYRAFLQYNKRWWLDCQKETRPFPTRELSSCLFWVAAHGITRRWSTPSLCFKRSLAETYYHKIRWAFDSPEKEACP